MICNLQINLISIFLFNTCISLTISRSCTILFILEASTIFSFYIPWKHQNIFCFLMFLRWHRKKPLAWNGLKKLYWKRILDRWFPVNFMNFFKTTYLRNSSRRILLFYHNFRNKLFMRISWFKSDSKDSFKISRRQNSRNLIKGHSQTKFTGSYKKYLSVLIDHNDYVND